MISSDIRTLYCALLLVATVALPSTALASHGEVCWLVGTVESLGEATEDTQHFTFRVAFSFPAARNGIMNSYDPEDCYQYSDTVIKPNLPLSIQITEGGQLEMIQFLVKPRNGPWRYSWRSTDGWEIDDRSDEDLYYLNDR
jgi:hypothetical protein